MSKPTVSYFTKPIIIWLSIIALGIIVNVLSITSLIFFLLGSGGLLAYLLHQLFFEKKNNPVITILFGLSLMFIPVLLYGEFYSRGYPITIAGIHIIGINMTGIIMYCVFLLFFFLYYSLSGRSKK